MVTGPGRYLNLVASAQAGGAGSNQVLAVEPTQGALQVIQILGVHRASGPLISRPRLRSFAVSAGGSEASKSSDRAAVIFSRAVTVRAGDVLDVRTHFALTYPQLQGQRPVYRDVDPPHLASDRHLCRSGDDLCSQGRAELPDDLFANPTRGDPFAGWWAPVRQCGHGRQGPRRRDEGDRQLHRQP